MKKGVSDPNENITTSPDQRTAPNPDKSQNQQNTSGKTDVPAKQSENETSDQASYQATHSEPALFRDPYAVLSEIVASDEANAAKKTALQGANENVTDTTEPFKDPFKIMIPDVLPDKPDTSTSTDKPPPQKADLSVPPPASVVVAPPGVVPASPLPLRPNAFPPGSGKPVDTAVLPAPQPEGEARKQSPETSVDNGKPSDDRSQASISSLDAAAAKLQSEIAAEMSKVLKKAGRDEAVPGIEIKASDEGILISLTDQFDYSMFAIGSAEPQARTIQIMDKIGAILKKFPGAIVIRGHTDGRPFKSQTYDNWRLSSARAHMAEYMLLRGGLDEKRIERIEGYADHKQKNPKAPFADENRRIEILLRKDRA